jgi:RNA polymerase sigma-70 factor (ECF subfamily)
MSPKDIKSQKMQAIEEEQFEQLFFKYHGRLVLYANKFFHDMEQARDVVQDVFFELWKKPELLWMDNSIRSYLFKAVKNKSLNIIRRQTVRNEADVHLTDGLLEAEVSAYCSEEDPLVSLLELEIQDKVEEVIENLPDKCREVFKLSRQEQFMNKQIAEKLGISVKMVEKQMSKALRSFRQEMAEYIVLLSCIFLCCNLPVLCYL